MFSLEKLKNHDIIITIAAGILGLISLILIYSTTYNAQNAAEGEGTFQKQILFFIIGFAIYFTLSTFEISWIKNYKVLGAIYFITIVLLIYVKLFTDEIANTNRWINILGFSFQPSEYAKIALIIVTAAIFGIKQEAWASMIDWSKDRRKENKFWDKYMERLRLLWSKLHQIFPQFQQITLSFLLLLPVIFLVFIQPSFGNTVIITLIWICLLFAASPYQLSFLNFIFPVILIPLIAWDVINLDSFLNSIALDTKVLEIYLAPVLLITAISAIFAKLFSKVHIAAVLISVILAVLIQPVTMQIWESSLLSGYQKERIETYFNTPEDDPLDAGYQVKQSQIAIGAGQVSGRGYLHGSQSTLNVLPFAHTDFIFASLAEQFGLVGAVITLTIYFVLLARILFAATSTSDEFGYLLVVGVAIMLLLNIFINIGMNMGRLPVTGIPLPLISYGGSSVVVNLIGLGFVQSIRTNRKLTDYAESFTPRNVDPWEQ